MGPEPTHVSDPPSRRDLFLGLFKSPGATAARLLSGSGLAPALASLRELLGGYRKLSREVQDAVAPTDFGDRPSELPRDMEGRGEFWLRPPGDLSPAYTWDPGRLPADLASEDALLRESAKVSAIRHGDASLAEALAPLLESDRPQVRAAVVEVLGGWRDARTLPLLAGRAERDPDLGTRMRAVLALKELDDPRAVEPLLRAALDREKAIRLWARAALGEWLPRLTDPALVQRVEAALAAGRRPPQEAGL
jgi:hypothetical protein